MELSQLAVFAAVAEHKSFSEAARKLYISHSSASRAVSALEKELGLRLVERDSNHVISLSPAGEALWEEAVRLLSAAEQAAERVRAAAEQAGT